VIAGALRPGMVATDLLVQNYAGRPQDWERAKKAFNLLAERVEVAASWLAQQILANRKNGARLRYLTTGRMVKRMLAAPFSKREIFE
jgi:hypothetical protein